MGSSAQSRMCYHYFIVKIATISHPISVFLTVCRARLDLAFLIDGSGSIERSGRGNFRRCLNFVKRVVASFAVSPSYTRVGIALFSSRAWLVFNFNRYRNKRQIFRAVDHIRYPRGGTRIGSALRFVQRRLFRRSRRRKVSIILGVSMQKSPENVF